MSDEIDPETLRSEWGSVWVKSTSKTHIMPSCRHVTESHRKTPVEAYPAAHIDLCSWCAERFRRWRANNTTDGTNRCQRCHKATPNVEYCTDCQTHIERMRARR